MVEIGVLIILVVDMHRFLTNYNEILYDLNIVKIENIRKLINKKDIYIDVINKDNYDDFNII